MSEEVKKDELLEKMSKNLKVLRNKLGLTQGELALKIGISRQTLVNIENKKRVMSWSTFVALLTVFRAECSTSGLLDHFGIYTTELCKYLVSPEKTHTS